MNADLIIHICATLIDDTKIFLLNSVTKISEGPLCSKTNIWANSRDYGTYQQGTSEISGEPALLRSLARAFAVRTHEVWK